MDNTMTRVRAILETTPARWESLTQLVPLELLTEKPASGQWSALECLQHIIDIEHVFRSRLKAFREGRDFPGFNPDKQGSGIPNATPADLAAEFTRLRDENMRELEALVPDDYSRSARHAELGPVTLGQMLNEWAAHDLNHTVQAEEALMQPFIRACGPWRSYFTAHIIGG